MSIKRCCRENDLENEAISAHDREKFYINEVDVFNTDCVKQEDEENEALSTQVDQKFYTMETDDFLENMYCKPESPKILEYFHDEEFTVAPEEAANFNNTANQYHHLNTSTVHTGATTATSYEDTLKPSIKEPNNKVKLMLKQDNANNEREYWEENKPRNIKLGKKAKEFNDLLACWKPELICDLCGEIANSFDQLRSHFTEKHKEKFYIKCCDKKFFHRYTLTDHIQVQHLDPNAYKCEICGKSCTSRETLKKHKKAMHELTKQLKCDICEQLFKLKSTLKRHLLTHSTGSFICPECGKRFVAEQLLKLHTKRVHERRKKYTGGESPKYPCDICGFELKFPNSLNRHKAAYHNDGTTIYVCSVCGKVSASKNSLLIHRKRAHIEEGRHKCTYCDKVFLFPKALREHIATHTGQDLYQCPHCPQKFKVSYRMDYHRKKVHPVEWEEGRRNRLQAPKINKNQEKKQIVII